MALRFLFILLFFCSLLKAQNKTTTLNFQNQSITHVIKAIETKFDVRFSFNSNILNNQNISFEGNTNLSDFIKVLSTQTGLTFIRIDSTNYIIKKNIAKDNVNICGNIKDLLTDQPISDVHVMVVTGKGTTTNDRGTFNLEGINKTDTITLNYLGYLSKSIPVTTFLNLKCPTVFMEADVTELAEVMLSEYITVGFDQNNKDGSVTLSPKKLGILPGLTEPDVLQSLQLLPGISSPNETASGLHIRGGTPDHNLVLWDGIKMYHQGHFFGQISAFNPYVTDEITLYRSGTSVKYGDRIGGVIDISSTSDIPAIMQAGGGFNLTQADIFFKAPLSDEFGLILSGRRSYSDLYETVTYTNLSEKVFQNTNISDDSSDNEMEEDANFIENSFIFTDITAKLIWQPNQENKLSLSTLFVSNALNYETESSEVNTQDVFNLKNNGYSLNWDLALSSQLETNFKSYYSQYNSDSQSNEQEIGTTNEELSNNQNMIDDYGFSAQTRWQIADNHSLFGGYDFSNSKVFYGISFIEDGEIEDDENVNQALTTHSAYGEYNFQNTQLFVRAGMRVNHLSSNSKFYFEPRLYADLKLSNSTKLKASAEIKNQSISQLVQLEFTELGVGNDVWVLADQDDIPVLSKQQYTAGILFKKNGWNLDADIYYNKAKGLTSFTKGFQNNSEQENYSEGTSKSKGIDVLLKKRLNNFRSWVSYSLSKTDFQFSSLQENEFAGNFDQRHIIAFSNTMKVKQFQFSLGWTYASGKPFTKPIGIEEIVDGDDTELKLVYNEQNQERLTAYHKLDASVIYDFTIGKNKAIKARAGVSALNIYNRKNEIDTSFRINEGDDDDNIQPSILSRTKFGLGFTPNFVFRLSF